MNKRLQELPEQIRNNYWPGMIFAKFPSHNFSVFTEVYDINKFWGNTNEVNLYFHIPFCKERCPFCKYFSVKTNDIEMLSNYMKKLRGELESNWSWFSKKPIIKSIAFGGGTPNFTSPSEYYDLFNLIYKMDAKLDPLIEPSMEVNPEIIDFTYMKELKNCGIKRLSIGLQSLNSEIRYRNSRNDFDFLSFVDNVRRLSLNFNVDLIAGLGNQNEEMFLETLNSVVEVKPESISIYPLVDSNLNKDNKSTDKMTYLQRYNLFEKYNNYLENNGYECESHIKFVRKGGNSTHQLKLYEYQGISTMGLGCGAVSYNNDICYSMGIVSNTNNAFSLINNYMETDYCDFKWYGTLISDEDKKSRFLMFALLLGRLKSEEYEAKFGISLRSDFEDHINVLLENHLIEMENNSDYTLTKKGRRYTDLVCMQFLTENAYNIYLDKIKK